MFICKTAKVCKTDILIPLWVLLWKYAKTRWYRYYHTFLQTFGGVTVFIILFLVYQINLAKLKTEASVPETQTMVETHDPVTRVFYSPYNNFTRRLMARVEDYLNHESNILPKQQWEFESIGFPIRFHANFFKTSDGIAEVKFKNNASFTTDLDYFINAICGEAHSNLNGVFNGILRSITPKEELAPSFLGHLQWAIDKSYMEQLSHQNIGQKIMMLAIPNYISKELLTLHKFMVICTILGTLPFYIVFSSRLIVERRSGMKEVMKRSGIYSNVLRLSHVIEALIVAIFYSMAVTLILKVTWEPLLPHSNLFIISITIVYHFVNTMSLSLITTALSQDYRHADLLGVFLYLSTFIFDFLWYSFKEYTFILCCILPHAPIYYFWDEVLHLETIGVGSQFWNIHKPHVDNFSVITVWVFFYVQFAVTVTLAWYVDLVRPGYYGVPKKWNFLFKKNYWRPKVKPRIVELPSYLIKRDETNFQKGPRKAEIAVQVLKVTKVFKHIGAKSQVIALNSVTFDCYRGEVTILLGGNGAGKTTLMLIIAGMLTATEGNVFIDGFTVADKVMELYHNVGICMQQPICFKYLTVKENIMFFKKLKGPSKEGFSVEHLLKKLKLAEIADHFGWQLTKGSIRCLQVACALAGDADVLVLDEPTTGMDVELRQRLWDLLMILRGHKTILMSTTCLEEANALGDRIAILDNGVLKCHGRPTFLKNVIGTSFTLSITIQDSARLYDIKEMVNGIMPELKCKIHEMRRIEFSIPTKDYQRFPSLLEALEQQKTNYGIILIDVGMFMEEVFLKFIDTADLEHRSNESKQIRRDFSKKRLVGCRLVCQQIKLLTKRLFDYLRIKKEHFIALRIIVPVLCLLIITLATNYTWRHEKIFGHQISQDHLELTTLVYNQGSFRRTGLVDGVNKYPAVEHVYALDVDKEFSGPSARYSNKETVGFKMSDNYTRIYHPSDPRMTSNSINMFSNIYMSMFMPHLNNSIRTSYTTLAKPKTSEIKEVKSSFLCLKWTAWVILLSTLTVTPIIILCIVERNCGIRDNHMMAGCNPIVHWGARLLAHMIIFTVTILTPIIVIGVLMDFDNTFMQMRFIGSLVALLLMFGLAFHTYLYLLSFMLDKNVAIGEVYITSLFFGVIIPILLSVLEPIWNESIYVAVPYVVLLSVARCFPMFAFGGGLTRLTLRARLNAHCSLNSHLCPNLEFDYEGFDAEVCCQYKSSEPYKYFVSYGSGLYDLINLCIQFIVFAILVLLLEYRIPQNIYEKFIFYGYKEPAQAFPDQSVTLERSYVRTTIQNKVFNEDVLLVDNVHKHFKTAKRIRKKKKYPGVHGVTYAIKLGECLAILGPKFAGKTTLLNTLAGTLVMTRGNSCINGIYMRDHRMGYVHKISLSSSTGGMDQFMTGEQNLVFIAKLKGYPEFLANWFSFEALRCMGLLNNKTIVSKYSSGCLRRLSLCSALVLAPSVAFLNDPMMEIDASSKPLVAKALQRLRSEPAAVIVAETSMDWRLLQPVFDRIAIMAKGQFAVIGPAQEILETIAKGYSARIKLKMVTAYRLDRHRSFAEEESSGSDSDTDLEAGKSHTDKSVMFAQTLNDFKRDFLNTFDTSRLCREHLCMLFYFIEDEHQLQRYSVMFKKLQELKEAYDDLIEDYYLSSTTIEDVFWRLEYEKEGQRTSI